MRMDVVYSYDEFLVFVAGEYKNALQEDAACRYGQAYFNVLWNLRPAIANVIRATKYDPFHLNEVHPETHAYIEQLWLKGE
jgi:hypothetical protein